MKGVDGFRKVLANQGEEQVRALARGVRWLQQIMNEREQEVWQVVQSINDAWSQGRPRDVEPFFDEDAVAVVPGFAARVEGRDAFVESYVEFCSQADIRDVRITEPHVDLFGDTAVATYRFDVMYVVGGKAQHNIGHDMFVLVRRDGAWRAVWRTMVEH